MRLCAEATRSATVRGGSDGSRPGGEFNAVGRTEEGIAMLETNLKYLEAKLGVTHAGTLASRNGPVVV